MGHLMNKKGKKGRREDTNTRSSPPLTTSRAMLLEEMLNENTPKEDQRPTLEEGKRPPSMRNLENPTEIEGTSRLRGSSTQ
ncbi:hypothetical protein CR513_38840, partial [Mucuna pruriens]